MDRIAAIEGRQVPDRQGTDSLTLPEMMDYFHVPAVSMAVIRDFRIDWAKAWGLADIEAGTVASAETLFQAASISKPVAAMASLKAVELGVFGLDQEVNSILRSWSLPDGAGVTPRMLMSHTSGTGDGFGFPGYEPGAALPTVVQILDGEAPANRGAVRLVRPPLTQFHYSGGAVTVQGLALSDATGRDFAGLMDEWVLGPAGMAASSYGALARAREGLGARGHDTLGRSMGARWHVYPEYAAAGLWTMPADLARFLIEVQLGLAGRPGRVLRRTAMQEMVTPVGVGPYGVGFMVVPRGQGWYFEHGGGNWGFRCHAMAHRAKGYGAVIMTNGDNGQAVVSELIERVARAYSWDSLDRARLR